jgi:hypothetical protein
MIITRGVFLWLFCLGFAGAQNPHVKIVGLEGDGAINNVKLGRAKEPVIEVVDQTGAPIKGATVTFILPDTGPSGMFMDGSRILTTITDEKGRAAGRGLRPNNLVGQYQIRISASYGGQAAHATMEQTNAAPAAAANKGSSKKFLWIALVGAAAAGGAVAAMGKSSSSGSSTTSFPSTAPGAVITPGSPSFGPPH